MRAVLLILLVLLAIPAWAVPAQAESFIGLHDERMKNRIRTEKTEKVETIKGKERKIIQFKADKEKQFKDLKAEAPQRLKHIKSKQNTVLNDYKEQRDGWGHRVETPREQALKLKPANSRRTVTR